MKFHLSFKDIVLIRVFLKDREKLMSDGQFAALMTVLGGIGTSIVAIIKWSVTRLTVALDGNTAAHLKSVEAMTVMSTKLDFVYNASREVKDFVVEERSGVHEVTEVGKKTPTFGSKKP